MIQDNFEIDNKQSGKLLNLINELLNNLINSLFKSPDSQKFLEMKSGKITNLKFIDQLKENEINFFTKGYEILFLFFKKYSKDLNECGLDLTSNKYFGKLKEFQDIISIEKKIWVNLSNDLQKKETELKSYEADLNRYQDKIIESEGKLQEKHSKLQKKISSKKLTDEKNKEIISKLNLKIKEITVNNDNKVDLSKQTQEKVDNKLIKIHHQDQSQIHYSKFFINTEFQDKQLITNYKNVIEKNSSLQTELTQEIKSLSEKSSMQDELKYRIIEQLRIVGNDEEIDENMSENDIFFKMDENQSYINTIFEQLNNISDFNQITQCIASNISLNTESVNNHQTYKSASPKHKMKREIFDNILFEILETKNKILGRDEHLMQEIKSIMTQLETENEIANIGHELDNKEEKIGNFYVSTVNLLKDKICEYEDIKDKLITVSKELYDKDQSHLSFELNYHSSQEPQGNNINNNINSQANDEYNMNELKTSFTSEQFKEIKRTESSPSLDIIKEKHQKLRLSTPKQDNSSEKKNENRLSSIPSNISKTPTIPKQNLDLQSDRIRNLLTLKLQKSFENMKKDKDKESEVEVSFMKTTKSSLNRNNELLMDQNDRITKLELKNDESNATFKPKINKFSSTMLKNKSLQTKFKGMDFVKAYIERKKEEVCLKLKSFNTPNESLLENQSNIFPENQINAKESVINEISDVYSENVIDTNQRLLKIHDPAQRNEKSLGIFKSALDTKYNIKKDQMYQKEKRFDNVKLKSKNKYLKNYDRTKLFESRSNKSINSTFLTLNNDSSNHSLSNSKIHIDKNKSAHIDVSPTPFNLQLNKVNQNNDSNSKSDLQSRMKKQEGLDQKEITQVIRESTKRLFAVKTENNDSHDKDLGNIIKSKIQDKYFDNKSTCLNCGKCIDCLAKKVSKNIKDSNFSSKSSKNLSNTKSDQLSKSPGKSISLTNSLSKSMLKGMINRLYTPKEKSLNRSESEEEQIGKIKFSSTLRSNSSQKNVNLNKSTSSVKSDNENRSNSKDFNYLKDTISESYRKLNNNSSLFNGKQSQNTDIVKSDTKKQNTPKFSVSKEYNQLKDTKSDSSKKLLNNSTQLIGKQSQNKSIDIVKSDTKKQNTPKYSVSKEQNQLKNTKSDSSKKLLNNSTSSIGKVETPKQINRDSKKSESNTKILNNSTSSITIGKQPTSKFIENQNSSTQNNSNANSISNQKILNNSNSAISKPTTPKPNFEKSQNSNSKKSELNKKNLDISSSSTPKPITPKSKISQVENSSKEDTKIQESNSSNEIYNTKAKSPNDQKKDILESVKKSLLSNPFDSKSIEKDQKIISNESLNNKNEILNDNTNSVSSQIIDQNKNNSLNQKEMIQSAKNTLKLANSSIENQSNNKNEFKIDINKEKDKNNENVCQQKNSINNYNNTDTKSKINTTPYTLDEPKTSNESDININDAESIKCIKRRNNMLVNKNQENDNSPINNRSSSKSVTFDDSTINNQRSSLIDDDKHNEKYIKRDSIQDKMNKLDEHKSKLINDHLKNSNQVINEDNKNEITPPNRKSSIKDMLGMLRNRKSTTEVKDNSDRPNYTYSNNLIRRSNSESDQPLQNSFKVESEIDQATNEPNKKISELESPKQSKNDDLERILKNQNFNSKDSDDELNEVLNCDLEEKDNQN